MLRVLSILLLAGSAFGADPPVPLKPVVVARTVQEEQKGAIPTIQLDPWETSQRYIALIPTTADKLTYDYSDPSVVRLLFRKPGDYFFGVPFDAPADTASEDKAWPEAKATVPVIVGKSQGSCTVTIWGVKDGIAVKLDTILIQVGPRPPPKPQPDTDPPKPQPQPVGTKAFWVVTVEDMTIRSPETAKLLGDLASWNTLRPPGHEYRFYDKTTTNGSTYAAIAAAKGIPLPAVLLFDRAPGVTQAVPVAVEKLPAAFSGIQDLVKKNGGKQ
jgi:hypothetical protein